MYSGNSSAMTNRGKKSEKILDPLGTVNAVVLALLINLWYRITYYFAFCVECVLEH